MDISMKDYVDARDAATASDLKAELAFVRSDIQSVRSLIENVPTTRTFFFGLLTTGIAILGILIALMSFGGDRFAAGLGLADQRQAQLQRDVRQDETIKQTNAKLDEILKRLPAKP